MTVDRAELASVLVDVRKAYRLLQAYHRRLNDLLQRVEDRVGQRGLRFEGWAPENVATLPGPGKAFFGPDRWAWELTPAYQVSCAWSRRATDGVVQRIGLVAVADTGYDVRDDGEPDPRQFPEATACSTELWIAAWTTTAMRPNWHQAWKSIKRIPQHDDMKPHAVELDGAAYTYQYLQTANVADIVDSEALESHVLSPIDHWLAHRSS